MGAEIAAMHRRHCPLEPRTNLFEPHATPPNVQRVGLAKKGSYRISTVARLESFASQTRVLESNVASYAIGRKGHFAPPGYWEPLPHPRMQCSSRSHPAQIFALIFWTLCSPVALFSQSTSGRPTTPSMILPGPESPFLGSE